MKAASSGTRVEGRKLLLICVLIGFCSCPSIKGGSLEALQTAERMSTLMSEFGQGDREKRFTSWADTYYKKQWITSAALPRGVLLVLRYRGEC
ncbi:uncharacterized protein LOC128344113 isoform X12 [Hemicordylus capensis]|uniref:uncharacterized protein LOC128344113 isoform X12 n=1 Tax=Hemicordylus capensis TaxID=884348 RepID=UPI00230428BA|nr:uncharacterized protein LOC128344113 isoform X12 [Hemicordylus capensis]